MGKRAGRGGTPTLISNTTVAWINDDSVNTLKTIDIDIPDVLSEDNKYMVYVTNPSTETALDVTVSNEILDDVTARYPVLPGGTFTVAASSPNGAGSEVTGLFVGLSGRLVLDNTTLIGAAGAFTARVQVWMV